MYLPQEPIMLLSVINTALRDCYSSLEALCDDAGISASDLTDRLSLIGVKYDPEENQFR